MHPAILLFFIKLPFVIKIIVLSIFEWLFYTGFTVHLQIRIDFFLLFLHQTYVVCTQKNCLNGTVLLRTQNVC